MTTQKPVIVQYMEDVPPDELHPDGVPRGVITESPTPALARKFHPEAMITGYVDGSRYRDRKARNEERAIEAGEAPVETPDEEEEAERQAALEEAARIRAEQEDAARIAAEIDATEKKAKD